MRILGTGLFVLALFVTQNACAQQPVKPVKEEMQVAPTGVSPEMWAYMQELRRQDDPKLNAQRSAQLKTQQRQARLASQQWYGLSNLRPNVNPIPYMSSYSPVWIGNTSNPFYWSAGGSTNPSVYVERNVIYR